MTLTGFLTAVLGPIIRPLIKEQIDDLKEFMVKQYFRHKNFEKYDIEAQSLIEEMAQASTSEERYAILQKLKNARARIQS